MTNKSEIAGWLGKWFAACCNGDWEHGYAVIISLKEGIRWEVYIDLADTLFENTRLNAKQVVVSESDWFTCSISQHKFIGTGGLNNLSDILLAFRTAIIDR